MIYTHTKHLSLLVASGLLLSMLIISVSHAQTTILTGEVNSDNINIRSDSSATAQIICQVRKGEQVEVVSELYDWYKIRLPKSAPAYVKKAMFDCANFETSAPPAPPERIKPNANCLKAKAKKDRINIRLKPSESSPILGRLSKDETVKVLKSTGDWYAIEPVANSFGWIHKKFVSQSSTQKKPAK